ncbi:MAG: hypothetical protein OSB25_01015 [Salibacteraceae bacterium]|nr:hypothetical protein [Salibacteraceae bacterium]|tara:strand:+ start:184 stop:753 length:570 start_codon:yes stop_codon:yes gene_type:complete
MENPSFFHLLTFLYIGFAKLSNNEIPLAQEMSIKRKIAEWLDLSYRNVDQYEMIMRESLQWFNTIEENKQKEHLLIIANQIATTDTIDEIVVKKILSEIRDISVSTGIFEQSEKVLHDELAKTMGINIVTIDDHCEPLKNLTKKTEEIEEAVAKKNKSIGFRYGNTELNEKVSPVKAKSKSKSKGKKSK